MAANAIRLIRSLPARRYLGLPITDLALAAAITGLAFVPTLSTIGAQIGDMPQRPADGYGLLLLLAQCVPLVLRSTRPAGCLAIIGAGFAVHQALGYPQTFGSLGLYVALYSLGAHQARLRRTTAAAATVAYVALVVTLHRLDSPNGLADFVAFYLALVVVWCAGAAMRRWRATERERRRLSAESATTAERARIARELHDVVTHHVTAMVVQADAAQFLIDGDAERAGQGLVAISATGREALTELRQLLGVLEATGESTGTDRVPAPGRVTDLVERARLSGQPVELTESGRPRSHPANVELAVYRVVQEALTNALKYAANQPTRVRVHHGDERLDVEVTTEGTTHAPRATPSGGRGLAGLRERLRTLDGELRAEARADGGFTVHAVIPVRSAHDRRADPGPDL